MRIESALNMGLIKIAQRLSEGELRLTELINIIAPVVKAGGSGLEGKPLNDLVWKAGIADAVRVCGEIITVALTSGQDKQEGNEEAVEK